MTNTHMRESRNAHKLLAGDVAATLQQLDEREPYAADLIRRYISSLRAENGHYRAEARKAQVALVAQASGTSTTCANRTAPREKKAS